MQEFTTALLVAAAGLFTSAVADQPVHCLRTQVEGVWVFDIQTDQTEYDIFDAESVCTH